MAYGDRMTIGIKDFGRKVVIEVQRGKIKQVNTRKVTIDYPDDENRNKKLKKG
jgi:hypothetical protein